MKHMQPIQGEIAKQCKKCESKWSKLYFIPDKIYMTTCKDCGFQMYENLETGREYEVERGAAYVD